MAHPIDYISQHPAIAFFVGAIHIAATIVLKNMEIPTYVMQWFQIGAWSVTIVVGLITIISWTHRVYVKYFKK